MLETKLVQAIGKQLIEDDFDQFMKFQNKHYFLPEYTPKPFTYAVRRPRRYPDGMVSIERIPQNAKKARLITVGHVI